jgi:thiol-disulfide isomerase/thioredoxin
VTPTRARPATVRAWWRLALAAAVLALGPRPAAAADSPVASLLRPLQLIAYPSRTTPPLLDGETVDGRRISPAALRGKVVLLNFWASWCLDCRPEMVVLERLHREREPHGLAVVGVNTRETADTVRRYARDAGLSFPLVLDRDGAINGRHGVVGLPTTLLVGRDGRAVALAIGPREWGGAPARALLDALLAEVAPGAP